jgi:AcrR family transcriptional regulator
MTPRGEQRRRDIVDTALDLFAQRGYHDTGVADIAATLHMSHGTFYRYFESKRAILDAVVDTLAERIQPALEVGAAVGEPRTAAEYEAHLRSTAAALLSVLAEEPRFARVLLFEATGVDDSLRARVFALVDGLRDAAARQLQAGVDAGVVRSDLDVPETARAINGLLYAGAFAALRGERPPDGYVDAALAMLLRGITTTPG